MKEIWLEDTPETFDVEDCGVPGKYILHNNGCWIARMSCEKFYETEIRDGLECTKCCFDFPRSIRLIDGQFQARCESEDWYFSRVIHRLGIKSYCTRKVALQHIGSCAFPNTTGWGTLEHDAIKGASNGHAGTKAEGNGQANRETREAEVLIA